MADVPGENSTGTGSPRPGFERMQQLTIYIKETDHVERRPLYLQILELVRSSGGAGATVLKGIAGYSASSRSIQMAGFADVQQHLPLVIVIVDMAWRVEALLPQFENLIRLNGGLITVQDLEGHSYLHPNVREGAHKGGKGQTSGSDA
jgi:PII-like signaling protein